MDTFDKSEDGTTEAKKPWAKPEVTAFASISDTQNGILT